MATDVDKEEEGLFLNSTTEVDEIEEEGVSHEGQTEDPPPFANDEEESAE